MTWYSVSKTRLLANQVATNPPSWAAEVSTSNMSLATSACRDVSTWTLALSTASIGGEFHPGSLDQRAEGAQEPRGPAETHWVPWTWGISVLTVGVRNRKSKGGPSHGSHVAKKCGCSVLQGDYPIQNWVKTCYNNAHRPFIPRNFGKSSRFLLVRAPIVICEIPIFAHYI